ICLLLFYPFYFKSINCFLIFFFQAEDGIRDRNVTGVQTCALPILVQILEVVWLSLSFVLRYSPFPSTIEEAALSSIELFESVYCLKKQLDKTLLRIL